MDKLTTRCVYLYKIVYRINYRKISASDEIRTHGVGRFNYRHYYYEIGTLFILIISHDNSHYNSLPK